MIFNETVAFPDHNIDPRDKNEKWLLQFAKAIWNNWNVSMPDGSIFRAKAVRYAEIDDYAQGRQSIDKYKKRLLADAEQDDSWMKIDWSPRPDLKIIRDIAVAKIKKGGWNINATPINASAADAQDAYYAATKAKILMRQALLQKNPQLANSPQLKRLAGEPENIEELEMEAEYSPKFIRAKDIEESVQLVFSENDIELYLDLISETLVDKGVGILKEYLDENNKVVIKDVKPDIFGCSYTTKNDFSDITWAFEVESMKLSYLSTKFDTDQIETLKNRLAGTNGNPNSMGVNSVLNNGYDIYKADVLCVKLISYNRRVTEENKDKFGNPRISKTDPKNATKISDKNKYVSKSIEVVYECKWVIGTELLFDFGLAKNQPRTASVKTMAKTKLGYYIVAANFNKMKAVGLTELLIPVEDDLCEGTYKLRNFKNRMVPNGFDIDLSAIEDVALGAKSQGSMTPKDVIDMFFETGILISRRSGIAMDSNVNYKAINAISNNMADQIVALSNDNRENRLIMSQNAGLNEVTDGSTPNPKLLTTPTNMANESTNNALYSFVNARRTLIQNAAKGTVQYLQIAIKRGPYDGFDKKAGKWITIPKSIADYDYDIMIEDVPGEEQKQIIYQMMLEDIKAGYVSHAEVIAIIYTKNLKHAAILLAYKVEKGKERAQQNAMQGIQVTAETQAQSNEAAETIKDKFAEKAHKRKMAEIDKTQGWAYKTASLKVEQANDAVEKKAVSEIVKAGMTAGAIPPGTPETPGQEQAEPLEEQTPQEEINEPPTAVEQQ